MAIKFANQLVLDGGLNAIKTGATVMRLIKSFAITDTHATVVGNTVASVAMASGDFTIANDVNDTNGAPKRKLTVAAKPGVTASAGSGAAPDLHIAFTDGTNVLWVTDETSNVVVNSGDTVNFPSITYTVNQPA